MSGAAVAVSLSFHFVPVWPATGRSERQRRGPVGHQRGQEHGVRPADGLVAAPADRLHPAQRLQPHGDLLGLVPPQGQPLHPLPGLLRLRRGGRPGGEVREEKHQGKTAECWLRVVI